MDAMIQLYPYSGAIRRTIRGSLAKMSARQIARLRRRIDRVARASAASIRDILPQVIAKHYRK